MLLLDEPLSALDSRTAASAARELGGDRPRVGAEPTVIVTHDFAQAALLADRSASSTAAGSSRRGTAAELSASPASAFVADFTGAVVLVGTRPARRTGTTVVALDGGGEVRSTEVATGEVGVAVYPWEITIEPAGEPRHGSALNRLEARVTSVTDVGSRVRVGLLAVQPLVAEVTAESVARLALAPGVGVVATWKATATRLVGR